MPSRTVPPLRTTSKAGATSARGTAVARPATAAPPFSRKAGGTGEGASHAGTLVARERWSFVLASGPMTATRSRGEYHASPSCYSDGVRVETRQGGAWITLDSPPRNVLDRDRSCSPSTRLVASALRTARHQDRGLPLGASGHLLCGRGRQGPHTRSRAGMLDAFHGLLRRLDALPQVTLAAVDGLCLGGGCELVLACDVVLATPGATFGLPEIDLGCYPPAAAVLLPRLAARRRRIWSSRAGVSAPRSLSSWPRHADRRRPRHGDRRVRSDALHQERHRPRRRPQARCAAAPKARSRTPSPAPKRSTATRSCPRRTRKRASAAFLEKRPPRWQDR